MADEPNKPVNSSNRSINGDDKLARIQARRSTELPEYTVKQQELEDRIRIEEGKYSERQTEYAGTTDQADKIRSYSRLEAQASRVTQSEERLSTFENRYAQKVNASAANEISTYTKYDNVNARTTTMAGSQKYFSQIQGNSGLLEVPSEVLEQRIQGRQERIATMGQELAGQTRGLGYGDYSPEMTNKAGEIHGLEESVALDKRLQKAQGRAGMTTEKRQHSTEELIGRAGNVVGKEQLRQDVAGGKFGSFESELNKLTELTSKVKDAEKAWIESLKNSTDENGELTEEYKKISKDLQSAKADLGNQTSITMETGRQGGGGQGERFARGLSGFNRAAATGYAIDIEDEMSEMRLKSGMGGRAVQQYGRRNAAIGGDMSALLREAAGQDFAVDFSDKMRAREMRRSGLTITSGVENEIGGVIDGVLSGGKGGKLAKLGKGLAGGGAIAAVDLARRGSQLGRGIPQTRTALEAAMAADEFSQTMLAIPSQSTQSFYNNYMAQSSATMGLGARAADAQWQMTNVSNISTMAELGISPGKSAQLMQQGVRQIGTTQDLTGMIQMAGRTEQSRLMGADQFMGMQGQLSNVGAGTFDLETTMKNAVAAGMDNAKNIQQMVTATTSMATDLAKSGVAGAGAAGTILGVGVQKLRSVGVGANIATMAAQFANESQKKFSSDISMDIGTIHEAKRISEIAPGIDETYKMRIASLTQTQMQGIMTGGKKAADSYGLGSIWDKVGKDGFKDFAKADLESSFYKTDGHIMMTGKERKQFFGAVHSGNMEDVPDKFRALYSTMTGGADFRAVSTAGEVAKQGKLPDAQNGAFEKQRIMDGQRAAQEIKAGGGTDPDSKMDKLITVMQTMLERLDPAAAQERVERGAKDMDETPAIVQAGDKFSKGTDQFAKAVGQFDKLLNRVDLKKQKTGGVNLIPQSGGSKAGTK